MNELNDFYNHGFGWICRHCVANSDGHDEPPRLMREGESESRSPTLSTRGLAKWADPAHRLLMCPSCGITELADKH